MLPRRPSAQLSIFLRRRAAPLSPLPQLSSISFPARTFARLTSGTTIEAAVLAMTVVVTIVVEEIRISTKPGRDLPCFASGFFFFEGFRSFADREREGSRLIWE